MLSIPHKRGDTFILQCTVKIDNVAQDITLWNIQSQVKQSTTFSDTFTVTKITPASGVFEIRKDDTTAWPAGTSPKSLLVDIQYTTGGGQIISTETFEIACVSDITV